MRCDRREGERQGRGDETEEQADGDGEIKTREGENCSNSRRSCLRAFFLFFFKNKIHFDATVPGYDSKGEGGESRMRTVMTRFTVLCDIFSPADVILARQGGTCQSWPQIEPRRSWRTHLKSD